MKRIVGWSKKHGARVLVRVVLWCFVSLSVAATPTLAHANPMREFVMSCSYGVLAGTLVGAATLAFADQPGESLNKIARGASIGLYAGILLGFYVVYGVPADEEPAPLPPDDDAPAATPPTTLLQQDLNRRFGIQNQFRLGRHRMAIRRVNSELRYRMIESPSLLIAPVVSDRGLEGAVVQYALMKF